MTEESLKRGNEITAEIKVRKELLVNLKREGYGNDGLKVINHSCNDSYDELATYPGDTVVHYYNTMSYNTPRTDNKKVRGKIYNPLNKIV